MKKLTSALILILSLMLFSCQPDDRRETAGLNDFRFHEYTIPQLQAGYEAGEFTVQEVVQAYLDRIEAIDRNGPGLNSVIMVNPQALEDAAALDRELQDGNPRSAMHGVPVLLKDNIDTYDMPTTAGSRALEGSIPPDDSWVAKKLREAGAVILGKANLSEWANFRGTLSTSGWSGIGGQTNNPYVLDRNPCGSSSGSGVAVSANLCMVAIGTETNGSIVCPSTTNGIAGIKPTVGLVSRDGIIPISFTQDTPGPMARTLEDAAICLGVLTGNDPADSLTSQQDKKSLTDYTAFLKENGLEGKRIGFYKKPLGTHYKVDSVMYRAKEFLESRGAEVIDIETITDENINDWSFTVMLYEFKDGLNKYFASLGDDVRVKNMQELIEFNRNDPVELKYFDQELLIMAQEKGSLESEEYTEKLAKMQKAIREEGIDRVMDEHNLDAIIAPTGAPAWKTDLVNGDHYMLGSSSPAAISGYPNITVPMGFVDGLPVGISFFGRAWSEPLLLEIAYDYEQGTKYRKAPEYK